MKLLLLFLFFISSLFSETTLCYKKDSLSARLDQTILLDGGVCQGKLSKIDMLKADWKLSDTKITNDDGKYNYIYIFTKESIKNDIVSLSTTINNEVVTNKIDLTSKKVKIYDLSNYKAKIKIGNLKIGQSGVIVHNIDNKDSIIIALAQVVDTNSRYSTIQIKKKSVIKQDAIPTSNQNAKNGDTFILNHLYSSSLLIVPNSKSKSLVVLNYPNQNFVNEDFFASYLKVISTPVLTKNDITNFTQSQQIGTIFIVIKNTLYIKDAFSFKTIDKISLNINDSSTQVPFYSKIDKIEKGLLDFGDDKIADYNNFYLSLVNNVSYSNISTNSDDKTIFQSMKDMFKW